MRNLPPLLFVVALVLTGCSSGTSFASTNGEASAAADAASSTTTPAASADAEDNDAEASAESTGEEAEMEDADDGDANGEVTIQPREARNDLTDPYCIDLESVFAAAYNIEVSTVDESTSDEFGVHLATYRDAVTGALEHAPAEHIEQLEGAASFAGTYANLSYEAAQEQPNFSDDFDTWYWLFIPDFFAEDFDEADFENPSFVSVHAELLCGIDTDVTYSFSFEGGDTSVEFEGTFSTELGDLSEYGVEIEDIVFDCVITGQREFEVDLSNTLAETLSFSGEVVFFDAAGEPTSGRSTFFATSVRPGERSAEVQESDDPTSETCEIDHMSWVRSENVPVEPTDVCTFSFDGSTVDIEFEVAGSEQAGDWINVRYGLSDADGVRRYSGLTTVENEPGGVIVGSTFDFTDDDRFATCEIVEKELL